MRKFDLELAKAGHLVCTSDGKPVRIICFDLKDTKYPIVVAVMNGDVETVNQYTNEGEYFGDGLESYNDLMMVSEVEESDIKEAIKYAIAASTHEDGILINGVTESEAIAWLEEQGEQTSTDEPKFKVGDWIVKNDGKDCFSDGSYVLQITDFACNMYKLSNGCYLTEPFIDTYRLWTIQDAKDGDVLVTDNGLAFIYSGYLEEQQWPFAYGGINIYGRFNISDGLLPFTHQKVVPATKEQRDLLFQKIKEAGYEWDAEKKELKKIEQKPTWSEEDELMLESAIEKISDFGTGEMTKDWLKSHKERYTWKPTEEQIQALEYQVHSTYKGSWQYKATKELLEQLKKL